MTASSATPIAPGNGATIGFLGGGQLGRMTALAARAMGYGVHVLDPDGECATAAVADRAIAARFDDVDAARDLARHCSVVTLEIEQIATSVIDAAACYAPVRPGSQPIGIIQDKGRQKRWLFDNGFPVGDFRSATSAAELRAALEAIGDAYVKSCHGGYDGRSQVRARAAGDADAAWRSLGERPVVVEKALSLAGELSVMIARRPGGDTAVFPVALNHHERAILSWSATPAPLSADIRHRATEIGRGIAETMRIEGLLAVELFVTADGALLVNELAPRPHNSFHATERACVTSQFEQLVRAVCDLPLGDASIIRPAAIVNLFGDLWANGAQPDFTPALRIAGVRVHLYGKRGARPGRKMGHISAIGGSVMDALAAAREAGRLVGASTESPPETLRAFGVPV